MITSEYDRYVDDNVFNPPIDVKYTAIALAGEVGEVCNEIKKEIRENKPFGRKDKILLELGDALHYLTALSHGYGFTLRDVMSANIVKLENRKEEKRRLTNARFK